MTSENALTDGSQTPETTSENTQRRQRGGRPTLLPEEFADFLAGYAAVLEDVPLPAETKRTYFSRVRMYLAWLASPTATRRSKGDPLTNPQARDWAVRDYRLHLLRDADPKRSVRYVNNALDALDDFHVRLGLGLGSIPWSTPNRRSSDGNR
jgi:hypothetical protein